MSMLVVAAAISTVSAVAAEQPPAPAADAGAPVESPVRLLGVRDAKALTEAKAKGKQAVTILVSTDKGKAKDVASGLAKLGGTVVKQVDQVGYVRAWVPVGAVVKAAKLPGVVAVDLDALIPLPDSRPEAAPAAHAQRSSAAAAGPGEDTPAVNPFLPTHETGAVAFKQANPLFDGRGVTVGTLGGDVDLDNPALHTTSTGERKIVDWITVTDPVVDGDGTWLAMLTGVTGPQFTFADVTWHAPAGTFRIEQFAESVTARAAMQGDLNRDGDTTDKFGVLYDPESHDIRVDVNQNRDFTDDAVMRPYKERFDVGHFGTDDPKTEVRDQVPFVVEFREDVDRTPAGQPGVADYVNIGTGSGADTPDAGVVAGNDLFGNPSFDGAAPGAKLVSARACSFAGPCSNAAITDGLVDLVVNRGVDLVDISFSGLNPLNDGTDAVSVLYNRLINDFGVQLITAGGGWGPGTNTIGFPAEATDVLSVAASVSKQTWLANFGSVVRKQNALSPFSLRGPREDGGFKPDITAPGSAITTNPLWRPGAAEPSAGYSLPPGFVQVDSTNTAAAQATGAAALLLSAAKASQREVTPAQLRRAIYSSAKWIDGEPAAGQGNGLFNVGGAWALLAGGVATPSYTSDAPVCTSLAGQLAHPFHGAGIYNRCTPTDGGHAVGQLKSYTVKLTRHSGPDSPVVHNVKLVGNDGTFTAPTSVVVPLNESVNVPVTARPAAGVHSVLLRVDDPSTSVVDFEMMNTVVAAAQPAAPAFSVATVGSVDRNAASSLFFTVPPGAAALQVNLSGIAGGSQVAFEAFTPEGFRAFPFDRFCYTNHTNTASCKTSPLKRTYPNPIPGVWELTVDSLDTSSVLANPFALTARIQGVTVEPAVLELPSVTRGEPTPATWTLTNPFGPVAVSAAGGPLGAAARSRKTIAEGEVQTFDIEVPAGMSALEVSIGSPSDPTADLDLFLSKDGEQVASSADADAEESVSVANPEPGTYQVEIDGFAVPAGSTGYDYRDVFFSPSLGSVSAPDTPVTVAHGATATFNGSVTALAPPPSGRQLFRDLTFVTEEGAVLGRSAIAIGSVS
jgi:hypothetical protein